MQPPKGSLDQSTANRTVALTIEPVTPEAAADWFDFFDKRAFVDNPEWKGCYCTSPFLPKFEEYTNKSPRRKEYAQWLIEHQKMRGYLAYAGGKVVGWCNVNDRTALPKYAHISPAGEKVLSIACFLIQKEYRHTGIAQKILERIVQDAQAEGVKIIEAYPKVNSHTESGNFRGPYSMYEKQGFIMEEINGLKLARKYLG